ncbi:MAG: hypothetical protein J6B51_08485, partial [Clostridia bacterium]|nr:hypothetical protein [Clostridia bacterium]
MNRTIKLDGNRSITVVSTDNTKTAISENDAEMDIRAKEAVRSAINRARTCKKPIATYDRKTKKADIETADGVKT